MNFKSQGSRPLPPVAIEMMPLKKPLLDSLLIIDSSVHRFIGSGRQILAAGLAGLLAGWLAGLLTGCLLLAAGWKDDERGGLPTSKDVSHARRSGEVGGFPNASNNTIKLWEHPGKILFSKDGHRK